MRRIKRVWRTINVFVGFAVSAFFLAACSKPPAAPAGEIIHHQVFVIKNLSYDNGQSSVNQRHRLDLYLPAGQKNYPVAVFMHGGAWSLFSKDHKHAVQAGRFFASRGIGTAVINYRLTPEVRHPGHIEDAARSVAWVHDNISQYNGKPDNIYLVGLSAGGHLASLVALDPSWLAVYGLVPVRDIQGVISICGVLDVRRVRWNPVLEGAFEKVFGADEKIRAAASPVTHANNPAPPILVIYAGLDDRSLIIRTREFEEKMRAAGRNIQMLYRPREAHINIIYNAMRDNDPAGEAMIRFILDAVKWNS